MSQTIKTVILGASGYTGAELLRFLPLHPNVEIVALTGESQAGQPIGSVYPHLAHLGLPDVVTIAEVDFSAIDLVFCCLPHATTQKIIAALPESVRIVDLSADFRLRDIELYAKWYGGEHQAVSLQSQAVYGLTEHYRDAVKAARLVANPGCYPTSALLPLLPLLEGSAILSSNITIDSKSGVTGAGRAAKRDLNFCEISEGMSVYGVCQHRHIPEMEQELSVLAKEEVRVRFTPHLIPMRRGMLTTIYATLKGGQSVDAARQVLVEAYANEPFVQVLDAGKAPSTHHVRATNQCHIGVFSGREPSDIILVSVIDNLVKGASGQAIQNMNVMFGLPETTALEGGAVFP